MLRKSFVCIGMWIMLMGAVMAPQFLYAQCLTPPTGMVDWWQLDETSGSTSRDVAGSVNNSGTWMGSPTPVPGMVGPALSFSGSNYVEVPNQDELNFGEGDFSIDAWIYPTNTSGTTRTIIDKREDGVQAHGYTLFLVNGILCFQLAVDTRLYSTCGSTTSDACRNYSSGVTIQINTWTHVAVTVDRDNQNGGLFYVNGNVVYPSFDPTTQWGSITNTGKLFIGRSHLVDVGGGPFYFKGAIDEVEFFNRVLTPTEVYSIHYADSYGKCKCATPPTRFMVAWWPLDEDVNATVVEDIAVNGYHPGTPSPGGKIGDGNSQFGPKPAYLWWPAGTGKVHGALYFWNQGIENRYIRVTTQPDIEFGTIDFSIDAWVFINQYNATDLQPIVEKMHYDVTTPDIGYRFYLVNGLLSFTLAWGSGFAHTTQAPSPLTTDVWHHVAATIDRDPPNPGATVSLYIDGALAWGDSPITTDITNTEDLFIGGSVLGNQINYLDLAIDEVELFDTVLTQQQIFSIVQADSFGKCKGYISGMKFHDHDGDGIKDLGDGGLANWTIFLDDYPYDGILNQGEPYRITDASGNYSFTVPPKWYRICEVNQSGWEQKLPSNPPYYNVGVQTNESVTGQDFGNYGCEPCSNNVVQNWSFTPVFAPWMVAYGTPDIGPLSTAWCDLGAVSMWGNQVVGEAIYQILASNFDDDWCYAIRFDAKWAPVPGRPYPVQFEFRASTGVLPSTDCFFPSCELIGVSEPVTPANTWMSMPTIIWKPPIGSSYSYLTVSATNQSSYPHGDSTSYGAIDRICIQRYKLGDVNGDGLVDVGDIVYLINYLFKGGPAPLPLEAGDYNGNGVVDIGDVVYLLSYLFKGGPPPASC